MPDDVQDVDGGGDPTAAAGSVDEGSSSDISLEQIAADFDEEALSTLDFGKSSPPSREGGKGEGRAKDDAGSGPSPASLDALDQYIERNYQGDRTAFVASLHESRAEARRLAMEVESMKTKLSAPPPVDPAVEFKAVRDQDREVQTLNREIQDIDSDSQNVGRRQVEIAQRAGAVQQEIARLEGQLLNPDASNQPQLYADLTARRAEILALQGEFNTNDRAQRINQRDRRNLERQLQGIEEQIRSEMSSRESRARSSQQIAARTISSFDSSFERGMKDFGIQPNTHQHVVLRNAVKAQIADYLDSLGNDADGLDSSGMADAVSRLLKSYADAGMIQRRSSAASRTPSRIPLPPRPILRPSAASTTISRTDRTGTRTATPDDVYSDPELVKQRAARIFNAASRPRGPIS